MDGAEEKETGTGPSYLFGRRLGAGRAGAIIHILPYLVSTLALEEQSPRSCRVSFSTLCFDMLGTQRECSKLSFDVDDELSPQGLRVTASKARLLCVLRIDLHPSRHGGVDLIVQRLHLGGCARVSLLPMVHVDDWEIVGTFRQSRTAGAMEDTGESVP